MTWTLRVYNGDSEEIGWLTADPYEWEITHPDGTDINGPYINISVDGKFSRSESPKEYDFIDLDGDTVRTVDFLEFDTPKDHLEFVQERIENSVPDATFTLKDE